MRHDVIHKRQFVIGPKPYSPKEGKWLVEKLGSGKILSYCPNLNIFTTDINSKNSAIIIGTTIQTNPEKNSPLEEISHFDGNIENCFESWSGRWICIYNDEIYLDFSGLLACNYTKIDGEIWISSSVALLADIMGDTSEYEDEIYSSRAHWYIRPGTKNSSIKGLLPSQTLNVLTGEIRIRDIYVNFNDAQRREVSYEIMKETLITGMENLKKYYKGKAFWIPLSAGYDSRLLLAAKYANIPVKTYTMNKENKFRRRSEIETSLVSKTDMKLPLIIARDLGIEHRMVYRKKLSKEKLDLFDQHSYKSSYENDRAYYAHGQWDWLGEDDVILLGQVMGLGCSNADSGFYDSSVNTSNQYEENIVLRHFNIKLGSRQQRNLNEYSEWIEYCNNSNLERIDWRDRFYHEQRLASWLSANQQSLDIVKPERIHLYNNKRFLFSILKLDISERSNKDFIVRLIDELAPELNKYPYNEPDPLLYKLKKVAVAISRKSLKENVQTLVRKLKLK